MGSRVYAIETSATHVLPYETARELFYDSGSHGTSIQSRYCGSHQFALFSYQSAYALTSQMTRFIHQIRCSMVSNTKKTHVRLSCLTTAIYTYGYTILYSLNQCFSL
jgi:hypothetical protein